MPVNDRKEVFALARALEACSKLSDLDGRQQVVNELRDIRSRIREHDDAKSHILSIVRACAEIPDGIDRLLEVVGEFDKATTAWPAVLRAASVLKAKHAAENPDVPEIPTPAAERQNLALVIGVSEYKHAAAANYELKPEQFTNLKFAADDARAVHRMLQEHVGYTVAQPLVNEGATLSGILRALDDLRKTCRGEDQTVLIYFSGHGASDADGRTYLVPHDARRDDLFATALWSKTFENALEEVQTRRLVVLLDACHAGAIGSVGTKDAELARFDPQRLEGHHR